MPPEFIYLDLGRVLVDFEIERMCRQVGEVAGVPPARVAELLYDDGLQRRYELGEISTEDFFDAFCRRSGTRPDFDALVAAASDIFTLVPGIAPVVEGLRDAGFRLGILSNTCSAHWEHCARRFPILAEAFSVHTLSYRCGAAKPDPAIYQAAARLAQTDPGRIFFTDDIPANVDGARAAGFDAAPFTSPEELARELRARGVPLAQP